MALSTYIELAASIADWINRDDLTTRIPAFIALCESKLNRILRVRQMEREIRITVPASEEGAVLPPDLLELRAVRLAVPPFRSLRLISPEQPSAVPGEPKGFILMGERLKLLPPPGREVELTLSYYSAIPPLEMAGTNWVSLRHPDLYLYGALLEAEAFVVNPEKIAFWRGLFEQSLDAVSDEDRHARWSGSTLAPVPLAATRS